MTFPLSAQIEAVRSLIKIVEGVSKPRAAERALAVEQARAAIATLEMLAGEREAAIRRLSDALSRPRLPFEEPVKAIQETLAL